MVLAVLVASLSGTIGRWPVLVQALFYLVAGIIWILPMKPVAALDGDGAVQTRLRHNIEIRVLYDLYHRIP